MDSPAQLVECITTSSVSGTPSPLYTVLLDHLWFVRIASWPTERLSPRLHLACPYLYFARTSSGFFFMREVTFHVPGAISNGRNWILGHPHLGAGHIAHIHLYDTFCRWWAHNRMGQCYFFWLHLSGPCGSGAIHRAASTCLNPGCFYILMISEKSSKFKLLQ